MSKDTDRAGYALRAYLAGEDVMSRLPMDELVDEDGTEISDLIADLLHLATDMDLSVAHIMERAQEDWEYETVEVIAGLTAADVVKVKEVLRDPDVQDEVRARQAYRDAFGPEGCDHTDMNCPPGPCDVLYPPYRTDKGA